MPKTAINQFSTLSTDNTDIDGININTGWPPSNVGPAVRELMAQLADVNTGVAAWNKVGICANPGTSDVWQFQSDTATPANLFLECFDVNGSLVPGGTLTVDGPIIAAGQKLSGELIGVGKDYFGVSLPSGYLWADGSWVSRTTYAGLFAVIGTIYGAGDGSTTFALPDKRGRLSLASDNLGNTGAANRVTAAVSGIAPNLGSSGGDQAAQEHFHGVSQTPHGHPSTDPQHVHAVAGYTGSANVAAGGSAVVPTGPVNTTTNLAPTGITIDGAVANIAIDVSGAGGAQNMPPVLVCNYIIYAGV